jgi:hypothetical protein
VLRRLVIALLTIAAGIAGAYWGSALLSISQLEAGLRERDVVKLQKYVDWQELREHLRATVHAAVLAPSANSARAGDAPIAALAGMLVTFALLPAADSMLDATVSPEALVNLLNSPVQRTGEIHLTRMGFTDIDEYTVTAWLGDAADSKFRLRAVLRRSGITWRVTQVVLPDDLARMLAGQSKASVARDVLKITATPRRGQENGVPLLIIDGSVTNVSADPQDVPKLRVELVDVAGTVMQSWIFSVPSAHLLPGDHTAFTTRVERPNDAATSMRVTFATEEGP